MKKLLFIFTIIASTLLSSCNNSNCEITYSSSSCVTLGNIEDWGAEIKSHEFENGLGKITFNGKVKNVPGSAFRDCTSLKSITLPNSITSIGYYAFLGCKNLKTIKFPTNLRTINDSAFSGCSSLKSIDIPDSVTSIGEDAFYKCSSLTSVDISDLSAWCKIDFCDYNANPLCNGGKLYINGIKQTNITIPSDITKIKEAAFSGCRSLTSITIPNSVTSIGDYAFHKCSNLTSVTIGNSVTSIGDYAFDGCYDLTSITIPNSVTKIGKHAFKDCYFLKEVHSMSTIPPIVSEEMFGRTLAYKQTKGYYGKIYVPRNSVEAYKSAEGWKTYADVIVGYDF